MFQGKDAVSRLMSSLHTFLSQDEVKNLVTWPGQYEEYVLSNKIVLKPTQVFQPHRSWVVPRITDYSRPDFYLDIQICNSVDIPAVQLKAFYSKPLALIKLETYVQFLSRTESRLPLVSRDFPFDVSADKASKTHCSERTMQRLYSDVQKYADKTNSTNIPTLIGFTESDIDLIYQNGAKLSFALRQMENLIKILNSCMEFDRKSLRNLSKRALAICNSDERSDDKSRGNIHECNFMRHRLGQASDREPVATLDLLVASILSTNSEQDIRAMNPYLSSPAYKTVTHLIVVAMMTSVRIGQTHRCLSRSVTIFRIKIHHLSGSSLI